MNFTGTNTPCYNGPLFNNFWDHRDITYESGVVTEPVTVTEFKNYARLQGFVDDDESPSESLSNFSFDDTLIAVIIKAARENFEEACGLSLIPKTIQAMITNLCGGQEIKYGPVNSITELLDENGDAITSDNYTTSGVQWLRLMTPKYKDMKIKYSAGYTAVPAPLKIDLLRLCLYMYMNRGDDADVKGFVSQFAGKYSRRSAII